MAFARFGASSVTLSDGRVLIVGSASGEFGGVKVDGRAERNAEVYDPRTGRFTQAGSLPGIDRAALEKQGTKGANPVPDQDPATGQLGSLVALDDGGAVVIGWTGWWKHVGDITRSFRWDPRTNRWTEIGKTWIHVDEPTPVPLTTPGVPDLRGSMAARLPDGRILVAGAEGAKGLYYDPAADRWSASPPMPKERSGGSVVVLRDGSVLIVGGVIERSSDTVILSSAIRFVPER
jgi:hypothetical protein